MRGSGSQMDVFMQYRMYSEHVLLHIPILLSRPPLDRQSPLFPESLLLYIRSTCVTPCVYVKAGDHK